MHPSPQIPGLSDFVRIGAGGNGVVYRAQQSHLRRVVAVKLLAARLDDVSAQRFAREGYALGLVSGHPNIVPIYSADTTSSGEPYLVMQLCEGGSLADQVERDGAMSWQRVLDLGVRICGALQTAHDAGLLHRDIKPGNILFDAYGVPLLCDFGQAQHADIDLTKTGDLVATPGFAAPEVLAGDKATVRSDTYALATTMAAAMMGQAPFTRPDDENIAATLLRVVQDPPPDLREYGVPEPVASVIERAMNKHAGMRQMSAAEFGRELMRAQQELGVPVTAMIVPPRRDVTAPIGTQPSGLAYVAQSPSPQRSSRTPAIGEQAAAHRVPSRRHAGRWIALATVVVLMAGAGIWLAVSDFGDPTPKTVTSASDLLIGGESFGPGQWQIGDDSGLVDQSLMSITSNDGELDLEATQLGGCLGFNPGEQIEDARTSALYYDAEQSTFDDEAPTEYLYGETLSLITRDADVAADYPNAFSGASFDTCLEFLSSVGMSAGEESTSSDAAVMTNVPQFDVELPESVSMQIRQIAIPLDTTSDGTEGVSDESAGYRYVTFVAMSAGTSVDIVIFQSSSESLDNATYQEVYDAFLAAATE